MDRYFETAYNVTSVLFGPKSVIPWWAWILLIVALFWKVLVPEPQTTVERDEQMLAKLKAEMDGESGKKGKKKKDKK